MSITSSKVRGALWMSGSALAFTILAAIIRHVALAIPVMEIVFFRYLFGLLLMLPWALWAGVESVRTKRLPLFTLRTVMSYVASLAWFYAVSVLPLADSMSLQFTLPLFTVLLAALILGERVGPRRLAALLAGFAGALVIIRPGFATVEVAALLVLAAAAVFAGANIAIKSLARTEPANRIVFYLHLIIVPMALLGAVPTWVAPGWTDLGWMAALGVAGTAAHQCMTRALGAADASVVMPFDFLRLPFAAVLAMVFFAEAPDSWTWAGAAIIFAASVYILRGEAPPRERQ